MKKLICSACVMAMMSLTPFEVYSAAMNPSAAAPAHMVTLPTSDVLSDITALGGWEQCGETPTYDEHGNPTNGGAQFADSLEKLATYCEYFRLALNRASNDFDHPHRQTKAVEDLRKYGEILDGLLPYSGKNGAWKRDPGKVNEVFGKLKSVQSVLAEYTAEATAAGALPPDVIAANEAAAAVAQAAAAKAAEEAARDAAIEAAGESYFDTGYKHLDPPAVSVEQNKLNFDTGYKHLDPPAVSVEQNKLNNDLFDAIKGKGNKGIVRPNLEIVKDLLDKGADANAIVGGKTILYWPVMYMNSELLKLLLTRGARISTGDSDGWTVLHHCALDGGRMLENVQLLLGVAHDVNVDSGINSEDNNGNTPLAVALREGDIEFAKYLIECGGTVNCYYPHEWKVTKTAVPQSLI